jgi:hypothetical protein
MADDLPDHYFRIRDNGAVVFRIDTENRTKRIELVEIATVIIRNGTIKPHGAANLTPADMAAITDWLADRVALLAERDVDDILRTVDHLNLTAHWVQARATDDQLDRVSDSLLLAMHDLRNILIRRKADRMAKAVTK